MSHKMATMRRAVAYSLVAGVFGGSLWVLPLTLMMSDDERFTRPWLVASIIPAALWFVAGFIIGAFGPRTVPSQAEGSATHDPQPSSRLATIWLASGNVLYRAVVGLMMGFVTTMVVMSLFCGLLFGLRDYIRRLRGIGPSGSFGVGSAVFDLWATSCLTGAVFGGLAAGMFGAVLAAGETATGKPRLVRRATLGSALGIVLGAATGAAGGVFPAILFGDAWVKKAEDYYVLLPLIAGVGGGVLAGVISGQWTRFGAFLEGKRATGS